MKSLRNYLYILAFLEGGSVMACELFGAKMIAPFFGSSLYVWAAALGVTLTALMIGYYIGGYVSAKRKSESNIYWVLVAAGILLMVMPYVGKFAMSACINLSVQLGATLSMTCFMLPPLLLMGMTSPLIINRINEEVDQTGKSAGSVYAISTFGGIISTFLIGFYLLPEFGIKNPALVYGLLLLIFPLGSLIKNKKKLAIGVVLGVSLIVFTNFKKETIESPYYRLQYESEGTLGQLKVIDEMYKTKSRGPQFGRTLLVNNTAQSVMDLKATGFSLWDWAYYFPTAVSMYPKGSKVLLLGLGGGTLVKQFKRLDFKIDVVELDKRIKEIAIKYFYVDPKTNIVVDDARHYINTTKKKYDIVTMDLFLNETPPAHVLSLESFEKTKEILTERGIIMINFYGYLKGEKGKASRSLYKTLVKAGYDTKLFVTPGSEGDRNLILLGCVNKVDFTKTNYAEGTMPILGDITQYFVDPNTLDLEDAIIVTDEIPALEKIYIPAALDWRKSVNLVYTENFIKQDFHLIN